MNKLIISPNSFTPKVTLDHKKRIFEIVGESRPQDAREFYGQIINWLNDFETSLKSSAEKQKPVVFNFNFDYFNSSSAKFILDICKILARLRENKINASVRWHHEKNDTDMLEAGMEISQIVGFPFEYMVTYD